MNHLILRASAHPSARACQIILALYGASLCINVYCYARSLT